MTGNNELFPYDVSINLIRNADYTRIHKDVGYDGEEEYTCLVYLNPNWKKEYYGETTFFEKNSDDTEIVAQVLPKYGRLVIFDGKYLKKKKFRKKGRNEKIFFSWVYLPNENFVFFCF